VKYLAFVNFHMYWHLFSCSFSRNRSRKCDLNNVPWYFVFLNSWYKLNGSVRSFWCKDWQQIDWWMEKVVKAKCFICPPCKFKFYICRSSAIKCEKWIWDLQLLWYMTVFSIKTSLESCVKHKNVFEKSCI
jgi:hypothetical protein